MHVSLALAIVLIRTETTKANFCPLSKIKGLKVEKLKVKGCKIKGCFFIFHEKGLKVGDSPSKLCTCVCTPATVDTTLYVQDIYSTHVVHTLLHIFYTNMEIMCLS